MQSDVATIVVFCQDPRFINEHVRFVEGDIGLESDEHLTISVLGGAGVLAEPDLFESEATSVINQMSFWLKEHNIVRYRLHAISHEDCLRTRRSADDAKAYLQEVPANVRLYLPRGRECGYEVEYEGEFHLWYGVMKTPGNPQNGLRFEPVALVEKRDPITVSGT